MTEHAVLSPSAASRWMACPASVRMTVESPTRQTESAYALEGTAAHALGELYARRYVLGEMTIGEFVDDLASWFETYSSVSAEALAAMDVHATAYVDYLRSRLEANVGSRLLLEQRLPTGIPECWGTSDAVIVSPDIVEICDLKYGMGVRVYAAGNPQLRLYGVGALESYGDLLGQVRTVRLTVFQPRLDHVDTEEISSADLRAWRDALIPLAEIALGPNAPFGPGEDTCRWCSSSGNCRAQMEWATRRDFAPADTLDDDELAAALDRLKFVLQWCAAVAAYALDRVYSGGEPIPGYKVVLSGGKRTVTDPLGAISALTELGYDLDAFSTRKVKGIGDLTKLLGGDFDLAVGSFVTRGPGSPSLVREADPRDSVNPESQAVADFS